MKVKLNSILAGPTLRGQPGQVIEVDDATGKQLLAGNFASPVAMAAPAAKPAKPAKPGKPAAEASPEAAG